MPVSASFAGSTYNLPLTGELNWGGLGGGGNQVNDFLASVASKAGLNLYQLQSVRTATASPDTVTATDCIVIYNLTVPGAVAVTLPAGVTKQMFYIVDGKGDAGTNNITITPTSGTINGAANYKISSNRGSAVIVYDGSEYKILSANTGTSALSTANGGTGQTTYAQGDLLVGTAGGSLSKLSIGSSGTVLTSSAGSESWSLIANANVDPAAAIAYSKLNLSNSIVNADIAGAAAIAGSKISPVFGAQNISGQNLLLTGYEDLTQIATPSAPGASLTRVYAKSDGKLYRFPNGGAETLIADAGSFVDLTSDQSINGKKTFLEGLISQNATSASETITTGNTLTWFGMNVQSGHTVTINSGATLVSRNVVVSGTLTISGTSVVYA